MFVNLMIMFVNICSGPVANVRIQYERHFPSCIVFYRHSGFSRWVLIVNPISLLNPINRKLLYKNVETKAFSIMIIHLKTIVSFRFN